MTFPGNSLDSMNSFLCIHSLTAHGSVGLKAFISTLGEHCLPVPSLLLTGPGNMPGYQRFEYDFESMLRGALAAAIAHGEQLTVFVGYLAHAEQVRVVARALDDHAAAVSATWVDPVCGDHGRAYVSGALIAAWPLLVERAAWVFPNVTEVELLAGASGEGALRALTERFPTASFVVTGRECGTQIETRLLRPARADHVYCQAAIPGRFSGTGDLFAAAFARAVLLEAQTPEAALAAAGSCVAEGIRNGQLRTGGNSLALR